MIKVSTFFTVMLLVAINISLSGQNSLDDLNIIFKHDFENNTIGKYLEKEYLQDWLDPEWNIRQSTTEIVQDSKNTTNSSKVLKLNFPANSLSAREGGANWQTILQPKYSELYVSYDVMFMPGFQYQLGGKLPSVQGGYIAANTKPTGYDGFTGGLMFKENGKIVFYIYYADTPREGGISILWGSEGYKETTFSPSKVKVNYACGDISYAKPGTWHNITYRMVLNTVKSGGGGNYDGIMEAYFDGKLVTQVSQILFRHTQDLGIDVMRLYSFFGGNTDDWRNPINEWIQFDNFLLYTYKDGTDVPQGNKLSPTNRTIKYWRNFFENPTDLTEPTEFKSTAQSTSTITLNWEYKLSDEQGFQIERTTTPNGDFVPIVTVAANTNSYTDTGLDPDKMYYYRIKAFNATESSSYVTLKQATSPVLISNAEKAGFTEIFANASGTINRRAQPVTMQESGTISSISLYHNGGTGNALLGIYNTSETLPGQRIAITSPTPVNTSAGWQSFKLTTPVEVSKGSTIWLAWVFENSISLRYFVGEPGRANSEETYADGLPQAFGTITVSAFVYSIYANYVPTQTIANIPPPPSNLHVIQSDPTSATIGWSDNAQNENGFEIERINTTDDSRINFAMESNAVNLTDINLAENTTYQYRIRAFNAEGSSAWSELLNVITPQKETETAVVIEPVDPANNRPVMANQQFNISEQSLNGNFLGMVSASDPDGQQLAYAIISGDQHGLFSINQLTGDISLTTKSIFGPGTLVFPLTVSVTDNATNPATTNATITIKLTGASNRVYIDPENTNDPLANGSPDHPFDSWSKVVWKTGFTYLQKRGTIITADKILIGANMVTLGAYGEGDLPVINSNTNTYLISGFEKAGITVRELNLQAPNAVSSIYFLGNAGDSIIVEHCQLNANVNAIKVANGQKLIVRYSTISSNLEGVYSSATNNQVYYNIFKNCQEAINIMGNNANAKIYNNVFYNNNESLSVTYADLTLYNNIFYLNSPGQSAINHGTGNIQSDNNIYYPEQAGFITIASKVFNNLQQLQQAMKIDINSFISDPQFMNIYDDNFLLAENSPAINTGVNLNLGLDLLGSSVPLSGTADIGVYEFTGIISLPENQEQPSLMLYPNPSTGKFNIMSELDQQQRTNNNFGNKNEIRVVDLTGKTVFVRQLNTFAESTYTDQIDLTGISNGLYFVILKIADKIAKEKILINN